MITQSAVARRPDFKRHWRRFAKYTPPRRASCVDLPRQTSRFWRSNAPPKRDSRGTTAFQLQRNPRLELDRPENINPPGARARLSNERKHSRSTFCQTHAKKSPYRTNPSELSFSTNFSRPTRFASYFMIDLR